MATNVGVPASSASFRAAKYLAKQLRKFPDVEYVGLLDASGESRIWIVIAAPPFDRGPRYRIYDVYFEMLGKFPNLNLDLRLANRKEYGVGSYRELVPTGVKTVWLGPDNG